MTAYQMEMRIAIQLEVDDTSELEREKQRLRNLVAGFGWQPRFVTAEQWVWSAMNEPRDPIRLPDHSTGVHAGRLPRRR